MRAMTSTACTSSCRVPFPCRWSGMGRRARSRRSSPANSVAKPGCTVIRPRTCGPSPWRTLPLCSSRRTWSGTCSRRARVWRATPAIPSRSIVKRSNPRAVSCTSNVPDRKHDLRDIENRFHHSHCRSVRCLRSVARDQPRVNGPRVRVHRRRVPRSVRASPPVDRRRQRHSHARRDPRRLLCRRNRRRRWPGCAGSGAGSTRSIPRRSTPTSASIGGSCKVSSTAGCSISTPSGRGRETR